LNFYQSNFSYVYVADSAGRKPEALLKNGGGRPMLLHRQLTGDLLVSWSDS